MFEFESDENLINWLADMLPQINNCANDEIDAAIERVYREREQRKQETIIAVFERAVITRVHLRKYTKLLPKLNKPELN
ncbi:MAG: hypothetical protein NVS4B8_24430 [Herpetosiphon sp.]